MIMNEGQVYTGGSGRSTLRLSTSIRLAAREKFDLGG
jgi:hypothetical protein